MECNFENCGYYTDGECNICGMGTSGEDTFCRLCKDNPKCYYKQLKWIQQEYVNLSKSFEHLQSSYQENQEYVLQLIAENDRLKEEVRTEKIYSSQVEELEESIVGQRNAYKKLNFQYIENCEYTGKLEQTLQEIKAIAEENQFYFGEGTIVSYKTIKQLATNFEKILDLITKAEEE